MKTLSVRLAQHLLTALRNEAHLQHRSVAAIVRDAVVWYLNLLESLRWM